MDTPIPQVSGVEVLTGDGGRVDWSHDGTLIAFDRRGGDGLYDVWTMAPDGSEATNLTGDHEKLGLPAGHKGNPAWHPSGEWLVIQVEKAEHMGRPGGPATSPGAGYFNDLWLVRPDGSEAQPLVVGAESAVSGALHPHFSDDGRRLVYSSLLALPTVVAPTDPGTLDADQLARRIEDSVTTMFGEWAVASVDLPPVLADAPPGPRSLASRAVRVDGRSCFVEVHAALADGSVLVSANARPYQSVTGYDVMVLDAADGAILRRVTGDAPDEWDEHAHPAPSGSGRIVFNSSRDLRPDSRYPFAPGATPFSAGMPPRVDLWVAEPEGPRHRVTWFNDPAWPHRLEEAEHVFVSDFSFAPAGDRLVAAIHLLEPPPFVTRTVIALIAFTGAF